MNIKRKSYSNSSNKRNYYSKTNIYLINFVFILLLVFFIGFFIGRLALISRADEDNINKSNYISIRISSGDTLESIAKKYNNTSYTNKKFIERIKNINNLDNDMIYSGTYLLVERTK